MAFFSPGKSAMSYFVTSGIIGTGRRRRARSSMRAQLRIVAGSLRGRKVVCNVQPNLRPTPDLGRRPLECIALVRQVQEKVAPGSVVVVQSERGAIEDEGAVFADWDIRRYGRNELLIWVREGPVEGEPEDAVDGDEP